MTLRQEPDAVGHGLIATQKHETHSGGHSWGYAYVTDGELQVKKETGQLPDKLTIPVTDMALVHTRLATRGNVNWTNAHPMKIVDSERNPVAALAHNGTWRDAPEHEFFSDTWHMARVMEAKYRETGDFEQAFIETAEKTGETMVALTKEKVGYVYGGRFSICQDDTVFQSTGRGSSIRKGSVYKIEENVDKIEEDVGSDHHRTRIRKLINK